ncbi:Gfo/Idh/MocA family oxidoreductase [Saccharopolyspora mangrovi]|uniref:Inositol 2-dehydrogenase n=1 Tax=Saccharopolyspora mangrovi TaxID=3082379 RepID=A0ABU6ALJ2_9PSEU|nr:Gfo/Idh/MocA family oxidoreductase [Saccharopolyspora sp. S2-29]MEB3372428.1 Gfo/Idh/MocA family oxidoreductase [Saccharopolyspora sp. S2-29]
MTVQIGVIGCGMMGLDHVRTLTAAVSGAGVAAVFDADEERAARAASAAGGARVHTDPVELVRDAGVDAVVVASPDQTHEEFAMACVEAGKPVLCEKPLATTSEACWRVVEAEMCGGRRLVQVGYMRRFDPAYLEMKRVFDSGEIGDALMLHSVHRNVDYPPSLPASALVTATGVHDIDIARWLLREEIVSATVHTPRPSGRVRPDFQDPQFLVLQTEGGVLIDVEIFVNAQYGYDVRGELVGERGSVSLVPPAAVSTRRAGMEGQAVAPDFRPRFQDAYRAELQAWVDACAVGETCGASAWDGYTSAAVAEACLRSLSSGRTAPVEVKPRPTLYTESAT